MQTKIPCVIMRGGTSRGPFFNLSDLPNDTATRDAVLLSVMGSPHEIQVDGIGGSHSVTDLYEDRVTRRMSVRVVDTLELVKVDEHKTRRATGPAPCGQSLVEQCHQPRPVG